MIVERRPGRPSSLKGEAENAAAAADLKAVAKNVHVLSSSGGGGAPVDCSGKKEKNTVQPLYRVQVARGHAAFSAAYKCLSLCHFALPCHA